MKYCPFAFVLFTAVAALFGCHSPSLPLGRALILKEPFQAHISGSQMKRVVWFPAGKYIPIGNREDAAYYAAPSNIIEGSLITPGVVVLPPQKSDDQRHKFYRFGDWFLKTAIEEKISFQEEPNKAPEPTTVAVTSRAPSSTSRASHGRGSSLTLGN